MISDSHPIYLRPSEIRRRSYLLIVPVSTGIAKGGKRWGTHQLCYVAEGLDQLLLSRESCQSLGIIGKDFPAVGSHDHAHAMEMGVADNSAFVMPGENDLPTPCSPRPDNTCDCPRRESPPPPPHCPPGMSPTQLREVIIKHYSASSFNRCTRQPLPKMQGEPMPIVTDADVVPTAVHTPIPVPLHWVSKVKEDLD